MGTQARFPLRFGLSRRLFAPLAAGCISLSNRPKRQHQRKARRQVLRSPASSHLPPNADPKTGLWSRPGVGRFFASHVPLTVLIQLAYGIDPSQIANKPGWMDTNLYDVDAKPEEGVSLTREELKPCLQDATARAIPSSGAHGDALGTRICTRWLPKAART